MEEREKAEREKLRSFIFEEFMKRDPDEITFERPDSGSGLSEGEDEGSQAEVEDEEFSDEHDLKLMEELKANKVGRKLPDTTKSKGNHSRSRAS